MFKGENQTQRKAHPMIIMYISSKIKLKHILYLGMHDKMLKLIKSKEVLTRKVTEVLSVRKLMEEE